MHTTPKAIPRIEDIFVAGAVWGCGGVGWRGRGGGGIQIVKEQQHNDIDLEELSADSH